MKKIVVKKKYKKMTDAEKGQLMAYLQEGHSAKAVAERFGISLPHAYRWIRGVLASKEGASQEHYPVIASHL